MFRRSGMCGCLPRQELGTRALPHRTPLATLHSHATGGMMEQIEQRV
jgi:hypothetical protein